MSERTKRQDGVEGVEMPSAELDDLLRKALATPPISNEDILKRSKESHSK